MDLEITSTNAADVVVSPSYEVRSLGILSRMNITDSPLTCREFCDAVAGDIVRMICQSDRSTDHPL
jgi:hypothetical protein